MPKEFCLINTFFSLFLSFSLSHSTPSSSSPSLKRVVSIHSLNIICYECQYPIRGYFQMKVGERENNKNDLLLRPSSLQEKFRTKIEIISLKLQTHTHTTLFISYAQFLSYYNILHLSLGKMRTGKKKWGMNWRKLCEWKSIAVEERKKKLFCAPHVIIILLNHVTIFDCHIFRHHWLYSAFSLTRHYSLYSECEWKSRLFWQKTCSCISKFSSNLRHIPVIHL